MANVKVMGIQEFIELLNKISGAVELPEGAKPQTEWYNRVVAKISQYAQLGRDQFQAQKLITPAAMDLWGDICDELCVLPLTAQQDAEIVQLKRQNNAMAKAIIFFMNQIGSVDYTITLDDIAVLKSKAQILGVADCPEHGIHIDTIDGGNHVH